jgi:hypothetical protein
MNVFSSASIVIRALSANASPLHLRDLLHADFDALDTAEYREKRVTCLTVLEASK